MELSRNFLFHRGATMDEVYQKLIDRTRSALDIKQLKTILGYSHRPYHAKTRGRAIPEPVKSVRAPSYDLTVFKVQWGHLTLKLYDKGARVLRVEVVVHNTKDLLCGKVLEKLPVMLERMSGMLIRFLDTVSAAHASFLDEGAFDQWCEPTMRGTRRLAGIDLNKARNRSVVDAVVSLATTPDGFTLAQLAETVRQRTGWKAERYSTRHAAYDLANLRGKQLVQRRARSRRYEAEPPIGQIARKEGVDDRYVARFLNLTTLAPEIVAAILDETLPEDVTLADLSLNPAVVWVEQRSAMGMAG